MKVQIFYPKATIGCGAHNGIYWPLTTLTLASYVRANSPQTEIEIFDGELYPDNNSLESRVDPNANIVGISATSFNYSNVPEIAKKAKENGSIVVLGGLHATYFGETILQNRPYIDAVIYGKGERAFLEFLELKDKSKVSSLIWRDNGEIRRNPAGKIISLDELPPLDYSLLDLKTYSRNHKQIYPDFPDNPMSVMTHEGCAKRESFGPCSFCSIKTHLHFRDPKNFWQEVIRGVQQYGFNIVKDWGDSLTGNKKYISELLQSRPKKLENLEFSVYNALADINQDVIDLLKRLNVRMLFAAVESANDSILKNMNKRVTNEEMRKAIKLMAENNIPLFTSYVLGERGETRTTLEETLSFAKEIRNMADVRVSNGSPMVPLPGSPNFTKLVSKYPELKDQDLVDLKELKKLWVRAFCPELPDYEILEEYAEKIGEQGNMPNRYGWDLRK
ncbi:MAG: radical SAM protein [Nanoarchaeota archaeon]